MVKVTKKLRKVKHSNKRIIRKLPNTRTKKRKIYKKLVPIKPHFEENRLCCSIRFYDNFPEIIQQFERSKKFVDSILVSNEPNIDILKGVPNPNLYSKWFLNKYPDNKFAQYLVSVNNKEFGAAVAFSSLDAVDLRKWASNSSIKTKVVIFDWDGTLSVIEGIILPPSREETLDMFRSGVSYKDIAFYYMGGKPRFDLLHQMFRFLHNKGVEVFILTNNPVAACDWKKLKDMSIGDFSRHNFFKLVKEVNPYMKMGNILCGYETNGFKPDTFLNNPYLREVYARIQHWHYTHSASANSI